LTASVTVTNTGDRAGTDVVQLYTAQPFRSVTRPVAQLVAYERVHLEPGESVTVSFSVPPTRLAFSDMQFRRVVEPGVVEWWVGASCEEKETTAELVLSGAPYELTGDEALFSLATISRTSVVV
jgi:beta-glucosidase